MRCSGQASSSEEQVGFPTFSDCSHSSGFANHSGTTATERRPNCNRPAESATSLNLCELIPCFSCSLIISRYCWKNLVSSHVSESVYPIYIRLIALLLGILSLFRFHNDPISYHPSRLWVSCSLNPWLIKSSPSD